MLVEDDNNLREIYEARLLAEGYEIISAQDGEEALALAVKEKPDLIIADIMMPKISGFDMLDILRATPETKDVKVVVMTALSQAEDKARANKLGANRYLVKSQVTLEDVAKVAREVLEEGGNQPASGSPPPAPADDSSTPVSTPPPEPPTPAKPPAPDEPSDGPGSSTTDDIPPDAPVSSQIPVTPAPISSTPITPAPSTLFTGSQVDNTAITNLSEDTKTENNEVKTQIQNFVNNAPLTTTQVNPSSLSPVSPTQLTKDNNKAVLANAMASISAKDVANKLPDDPRGNPGSTSNTPLKSASITSDNSLETTTSAHTKVISPISDTKAQSTNLQELLAKEEAKEPANGTVSHRHDDVIKPDSDPNSISL